ncbi:TPA: hypothetical protein ACH3X1_011610 [Trebouxia sp. C0004]
MVIMINGLKCHDIPVSTGHARRRSEAVANLEPYVDRMANQYNKSSKVHWFEVGQLVGLQIPSETAFDIAAAIQGSFTKGSRHQDIPPFNIVVYRVRECS